MFHWNRRRWLNRSPAAGTRYALLIAPWALGGGRALVLGGGAIGLAAALALRAFHAADVTIAEPNAMRRGYLERNCAQDVVDPEAIPHTGCDIVVDAVGFASTRAAASERVRPGGMIIHIGLGSNDGGLDIRRMTLQEITFVGAYTYSAEDFRATAQAMFDGRLGPLDWYETRPLSDGAAAFADIRAGRVAAPKIILRP